MTELRNRPVEHPEVDHRFIQSDLPGSRRQQIFAAQHVRDLHGGVIGGVHQRVERLPIGTLENKVGNLSGCERDLTADEVVPGAVPIGHAKPHHRDATFGAISRPSLIAQVSTVSVVARGALLSHRLLTSCIQLFGRAEAFVRVSTRNEGVHHRGVVRPSLGLSVRTEGASHFRSLIPIESEPLQRIDECLVGLLAISGCVRVLDTKNEGAAGVSCERPVEQGGADQPHMRIARG